MKQKYNLIGNIFLRSLLSLAMMVSIIVPMTASEPKIAQAWDLCSGIDIIVEVFDVTTGQLVGYYNAYGDTTGWEDYNVNLTYNHVYRYTIETEGTPSFTMGRSYQSGGYVHEQHTYSPNPTPGMSNVFSAPAITANGTFFGGVYENFCSANPPNYGGEGANVFLNLNVVGGPSPVLTRTGNASLAVVKNPTVSLLANGSSSTTIPAGNTVSVSWSTDSVNLGDSCVADNDNTVGKGVDPSWSGPKNGQRVSAPPLNLPDQNGGQQDVGPFDNEGSYTYTIYCYGLNNVQSALASVQIIVGSPPTYVCSASPASQFVTRGSNGSAAITTTPFNGYGNPVTFSASVVGSGTVPTVSFSGNGQVPAATTTATITTTASTSIGAFQITFTGTDGVSCPPITFHVQQVLPDASITCNGLANSCNVAYEATPTIAWSSTNVSSCSVYDPTLFGTGLSGSKVTSQLRSTTTYELQCTGPYGSVNKTVTVNVAPPANLNPPTNVAGSPAICGTVLVTWQAPVGNPQPTHYKVYRRLSDIDPAPGLQPGPQELVGQTEENSGALSYLYTGAADNQVYDYGVSAMYGQTAESSIAWSSGVQIANCAPSLEASYKKIVGAGTQPNMAGNWCSGAANGYTLPVGQVFQSGDLVYFEICVDNTGSTQNLSAVRVTESLADIRYLENIQFVSSESSCANDMGSYYDIGDMPFDTNPGIPGNQPSKCGLLIKATISNPGGSTGVLRNFVNTADITSSSIAKEVTINRPFFVGAGEPTRNETPR